MANLNFGSRQIADKRKNLMALNGAMCQVGKCSLRVYYEATSCSDKQYSKNFLCKKKKPKKQRMIEKEEQAACGQEQTKSILILTWLCPLGQLSSLSAPRRADWLLMAPHIGAGRGQATFN